MELILKALQEAQAVLTEYITPRVPQPGLSQYQETCLKLEASEKVINKLFGILDNRELVQQQRECERINGGDNIYTSAIKTLETMGFTYNATSHWSPPEAWAPRMHVSFGGKEGPYVSTIDGFTPGQTPYSFQECDLTNPGPARPFIKEPIKATIDPNVEAVRKMLLDRSALGFKKYGIGTNRNDLQLADWLQHMQEELCDAAVYIQAAKAGANPYAEELAEAKTELGRVAAYQKGLQSRITELVGQSAGHKENSKQLQRENTELRARLQAVSDAMKGEKF